ncbi:SDR family oxidoreductase [Haliea sp. E17]|uniref:SDR family oxidoreductase n=1 Tax=Haliea sp. E17 TaxID=3401576 RepID=UPI003AB0E093
MNFADKRIFLTGATGGIGRELARRLAGFGAKLVLIARDARALEETLALLPGSGHSAVVADVATGVGRASVLSAAQQGVDILINNAGVNYFGLLPDLSEQQVQDMVGINLLAPILLIRALLPGLVEAGGAIVNIGSGYGSIGFPGYSGYCASKFGLRGFTEALQRELSDQDIRVLYIAPRAVATAMNPPEVVALNRQLGNAMDQPANVASAVMDALRHNRKRRFLGWPERLFVKINGVFPGLVDRALKKQLPLVRKQALATTGANR